MTEKEWMKCARLDEMLDILRDKASERKLRLFACGCCRLIWNDLAEQCRKGIEVAERFADGQASNRECEAVLEAVHRVKEKESDWHEGDDPDDIDPGAYAVEFALYDLGSMEIAGGAADQSCYAGDFGQSEQCEILRDIFGNPFRTIKVKRPWLSSAVVSLAQTIYDETACDRMPLLAEALEESGCDNADILNHCRSERPHVKGCWVTDLILGKT